MGEELKDMSLEELWKLFPIILKPHNPAYKQWYVDEEKRLKDILKDHSVCRINHIGSTAVEGLIAKPTVDILLELPADYDMSATRELLLGDDWVLMAQDEAQKTLDLNKGYTPTGFAEKVYHLHVKPSGDWDELYFRDYLWAHPEMARQYEALKLDLKEQFEHNRDAYTDAKTAFIAANTQKAREAFGGRYLPISGGCI